jgi:hypothetical protein
MARVDSPEAAPVDSSPEVIVTPGRESSEPESREEAPSSSAPVSRDAPVSSDPSRVSEPDEAPEEPQQPPAAQAASPWQGPTEARDRGRRYRALLGHAALLGVAAAALAVLVTATPTFVAVAQGEGPVGAKRGIARALWKRGYAVGPSEPSAVPKYGLDPRLEPPLGLEAPPLPGMLDRWFEGGGDAPGDSAGGPQHIGAIARTSVTVLDRPSADGHAVAEVPRGQTLVIIEDRGAWLHVALLVDDGVKRGWARREALMLVP